MLAIFHDMIEESVEVFKDDFSVFGNSFKKCLNYLDKMFQHCKDAHLVLNWEKYTPFEFDDECQKAFELLKEKLTYAPVIVSPNWNLLFELMCDASDFTVGAVLVFDIEIKDRKGTENVAVDHLSHINNNKTSEDSEVDDNFLGETLMEINTKDEPWFANFANYLEEPYLFKVCFDGMIRRCVYGPETRTILDQCHHGPTGGHYGPNVTAKKVLDSGFCWPTIIKEAHTLVCLCEACQKTGIISKRDEMPLTNIQVCEIFDVWGIDFMRPFPKSYKFEYILIAVDYVSKWAEAQALPTNDARVVITFLKKLLCRFGMPKALISDRGTQICNKMMEKTMKIYGVSHRFSKSYHPQTSGQVENTNRALKRILEKTVKDNPAIWSRKLDDTPYVELYRKDGKTFMVNGHRLKLYHEEEDYNDQREAATPFFPKEWTPEASV
ncbi:reverse transcriptase domain-containing protein [Tanacetum coccineum]|uniref:Reverse transcriptase domain-containing protein n=1 Tax=Tanacetum coccineum TaxID=301880 RepID=A0ABQ4WKR4_9ASTR